jgi:type I restriction enzyme S subunit
MKKEVYLTSICRPKQWKTISTKDLKESGFPDYGANGKIGFYDNYTHKDPTLLITCRGATCGSINISEPKSYVNGNAMALDGLSQDVDLYYLAHYLRFRKLDDVISGSAQPQITGQGLSKIKIPLPPLDQQKKIASILDAADEYRQKTKALIAKYDELTQSLFLDMFGDVKINPFSFSKTILNAVCNKITDGEHGTVERTDNGKLYLMARNIRDNYIDLTDVSYISEKDHQKIYKRCNAEKGDILIVCVGATIGRLCITPEMEDFSLARSVALLKPNKEKIESNFLYSILNTKYIQEVIKRSGNSSAQAGLYTGKIKELEIYLPPIKLQTQFAERVQVIEKQKAQAQASLEKAEELFNSLLQRAFRGELV